MVRVIPRRMTGPDISFGEEKEPLLQDARHLVDHLEVFEVTGATLVIDVEAQLGSRVIREARRPDAMAPETFQKYFPDGGEMTEADAHRLGDHYRQLNNGGDDLGIFYQEARDIFETFLFPHLTVEGNPSKIEKSSRKEM